MLGQAYTAFEEGFALYNNGEYGAAIASFKEALELHGKPSCVLEGWVGLSYLALGEYSAAIEHLSNAVNI